jgi:hypothetical protein
MSSTAKILNSIIIEKMKRDPDGVARMVRDYLQAQVGESTGVFGISVEGVGLVKKEDVIRLHFTLHLDKKEVQHEARWVEADLLTFDTPITQLIRDELNQALSNLHGG